MRVSRSFIVRTSEIKGINGNLLETNFNEDILIGSIYR
jgi:hypothetical protein